MYLDGREIDIRKGGQVDPTKTEGNVKVMSAWIDSNLLGKPYITKAGESKIVTFNGKYDPTMEPYAL